MIPLIITGIFTGLALLVVHSYAQAQDEKPGPIPPVPTDGDEPLRRQGLGFLKYVNGGGSDENRIRAYQRAIGAPVTGNPDRQSELRVEQILGYNVSWRPTKKKVAPRVYPRPATKQKTTTAITPARTAAAPAKKIQGPLEEMLQLMAKPKPSPAKPPKQTTTARARPAARTTSLAPRTTRSTPKPLAKTAPATVESDSVTAARLLNDYLVKGGLDRTVVKGYQGRMGAIAADGVAGPKTKARAEKLLGRTLEWPAISAAIDLHSYYVGAKGRDKDTIKSYQRAMGELVVDGLVGAKTKARYKSLTGRSW